MVTVFTVVYLHSFMETINYYNYIKQKYKKINKQKKFT